jgi:hypothetical protein
MIVLCCRCCVDQFSFVQSIMVGQSLTMNLISRLVINLLPSATYTRYALTVSLYPTNKPSTALGSSLRRSASGTYTNALVPKARKFDTLGFFPKMNDQTPFEKKREH